MEWYAISDLTDFINAVRNIIYSNYGSNSDGTDISTELSDEEKKELDSILSYEESYTIVLPFLKQKQNKKNQTIEYKISDKIFAEIINALGDRMTSNLLNGLVNKGLVEAAYDNELDDFVFWVKDEHNTKEKPETD